MLAFSEKIKSLGNNNLYIKLMLKAGSISNFPPVPVHCFSLTFNSMPIIEVLKFVK